MASFDRNSLTDDELTLMFTASIVLIRGASHSSDIEKQQALTIADMALKSLAQSGGMPAFITKVEVFAGGDSGQTVHRRVDQGPKDVPLTGEDVPSGS